MRRQAAKKQKKSKGVMSFTPLLMMFFYCYEPWLASSKVNLVHGQVQASLAGVSGLPSHEAASLSATVFADPELAKLHQRLMRTGPNQGNSKSKNSESLEDQPWFRLQGMYGSQGLPSKKLIGIQLTLGRINYDWQFSSSKTSFFQTNPQNQTK